MDRRRTALLAMCGRRGGASESALGVLSGATRDGLSSVRGVFSTFTLAGFKGVMGSLGSWSLEILVMSGGREGVAHLEAGGEGREGDRSAWTLMMR